MSLFVVLLWCMTVISDVLQYNSWFGGFNSRLGPNKFPFSSLRELAGKQLIWLAVCRAGTALFGSNRKNSQFYGNNWEVRFTSARRLDQHVDAAGGGGEFAPGLVVDRHAMGEALGAGQTLRITRDQDRLVRTRRRRGGDVGGHRGDLLAEPLAVDEPRRIDHDRQHTVRRRASALPLGPHRAAAAQRAGEYLAHEGQRIALVLAEGQHRASRLAVHRSRIGGRPPLAVEQNAGLQLLALVARDADLAHRDDACRHVEDDRPRRLGSRDSNADGVGAEARIGAVPRRHGRPRIGDIDEMERDETRLGADLAICPDPADMMRVAQRDDRNSGFARLGDADHHRLARGDLAPGALAVIDDQGAVLADHTPPAIGEHRAAREMAEIVRDQADAMTVVAAKIGLDQVIGDDQHFFGSAAGGLEYARSNSMQCCMVDQHHSDRSFRQSDWRADAAMRSGWA